MRQNVTRSIITTIAILMIMVVEGGYGRPALASAHASMSMMRVGEDNMGWWFDNGREFAGATGCLGLDQYSQHGNQMSLRLMGDFTHGGAYVRAQTNPHLDKPGLSKVTMWVRCPNTDTFVVQLADGTDQCHQFHVKVEQSDSWQKVVLGVADFFAQANTPGNATISNYENWGGANDKRWHGTPKTMSIILSPGNGPKVVSLWFCDVTVYSSTALDVTGFRDGFEGEDASLDGWSVHGKVLTDGVLPYRGERSLVLRRTAETADLDCSATSPTFAVAPGTWTVSAVCRSALTPVDPTFDGVITIEYLDGDTVVDREDVAHLYGTRAWEAFSTRVTVPSAASTARFVARINKALGGFRVDNLDARFSGESSAAP